MTRTPPSTPSMTDDPFAALPSAAQRELAAASAITPEDVDDALRTWRTDAAPAFRTLLDASPDDAPVP